MQRTHIYVKVRHDVDPYYNVLEARARASLDVSTLSQCLVRVTFHFTTLDPPKLRKAIISYGIIPCHLILLELQRTRAQNNITRTHLTRKLFVIRDFFKLKFTFFYKLMIFITLRNKVCNKTFSQDVI